MYDRQHYELYSFNLVGFGPAFYSSQGVGEGMIFTPQELSELTLLDDVYFYNQRPIYYRSPCLGSSITNKAVSCNIARIFKMSNTKFLFALQMSTSLSVNCEDKEHQVLVEHSQIIDLPTNCELRSMMARIPVFNVSLLDKSAFVFQPNTTYWINEASIVFKHVTQIGPVNITQLSADDSLSLNYGHSNTIDLHSVLFNAKRNEGIGAGTIVAITLATACLIIAMIICFLCFRSKIPIM